MKKFLVVSVVTLLFMFCTGYSQLSTAFCTTITGKEVLRRCSLSTQTPSGASITAAENIYAHHAGSRLYRSNHPPASNTVVPGGGRIIQP